MFLLSISFLFNAHTFVTCFNKDQSINLMDSSINTEGISMNRNTSYDIQIIKIRPLMEGC